MGMSAWRAYQPSAAFKAAISCGPSLHYPCHSGTIVVHPPAPFAQGHAELTTMPSAVLIFRWPYIASLAASHIPVPAPVPAS